MRENKVVDVSLIGGLVGLFSSPRRDSKGITALMIAVANNQNRFPEEVRQIGRGYDRWAAEGAKWIRE